MVLVYNFPNEKFRDGKDLVEVHKPVFEYEVDNKDCWGIPFNLLHDYYRNDALEAAAYETMIEYSDSCFKCK